MEFTSWERKPLETSRRSPDLPRKKMRLLVIAFAMIVIGVACSLIDDFTVNRVAFALVIVGANAMLVEYTRFKSRVVQLLQKVTSDSQNRSGGSSSLPAAQS